MLTVLPSCTIVNFRQLTLADFVEKLVIRSLPYFHSHADNTQRKTGLLSANESCSTKWTSNKFLNKDVKISDSSTDIMKKFLYILIHKCNHRWNVFPTMLPLRQMQKCQKDLLQELFKCEVVWRLLGCISIIKTSAFGTWFLSVFASCSFSCLLPLIEVWIQISVKLLCDNNRWEKCCINKTVRS